MKHLTTEDIVSFISADTWNKETAAFMNAVNTHVRDCGECLMRLRAYLDVKEGFDALIDGEFSSDTVSRSADAPDRLRYGR